MTGGPRPDSRIFGLAVAAGRWFSWLFIAAIILSAYEVVMRYGFGAPSSWALPLTTTLCQIGFALGGAWCMVKGEHIRITFIPDKLSPARRWWVELVALMTGIFYLGGLLYAVWLDAKAAIWKFGFDGKWAPENTPGPPNWPLPSIGKAALVIGTALFLAVVAVQLFHHVAHRDKRPGKA